jgi:Zn-dependent metalloprotease
VALVLGLVATAQAEAPGSDPRAAEASPAAAGRGGGPGLDVRDGAGLVRLLGAPGGRTLAAAPAGTTSPAGAARAHVRRYAGMLGLDARDLDGLRTAAVTATGSGQDVVRLQQTVAGVPVLGAQLVAVLDRAGSLLSLGGETSRRVRSAAFERPAAQAAGTAVRSTARASGLPRAALRAGRPTRALLDPVLLVPGGRAGALAVWRVEVTAPGRPDVRDLVLVDAASGRVAARIGQVAHLLDRVVCDRGERPSGSFACRPGQYTRVEGSASSGVPDVDQAYDLTGSTADWYATRLGVDLTALIGADFGDGPKIRSTTRYCPRFGCPLDNAFWSGDQMVYGTGFTSADDVVAHELTHGVTQRTAGLMYWFQSGAINESMSDVFGELVDLANGTGTDTPEARWLLGEDLGPRAGGVARDMAAPPVFGQPDRTGSDLYEFAPDYDDNGGVHTNSGVPNKAAYLVVDGTVGEPGGVFNGRAFPGIGPDKAALVYWSALLMLTPGADFTDLAAALQQSCANLAGAGAGGLTGTDCQSVAAATAATGMASWPGPTVPRRVSMVGGVRSVSIEWDRPAGLGSSPLNSFAVTVQPALGEEDFFPIEPSSRRYRLTGLAKATDYRVGLVAVTADGTSAPVARTFQGSALQVTWPPSLRDGVAKVRGTLAGAGGAPLRQRRVRLFARPAGTASYVPVDAARTAADGGFRLRLRTSRAGSYYVEYAGSQRTVGARSAKHALRPRGSD